MAKIRLIWAGACLWATVLFTSCNSVVVRQAELISALPRTWTPVPREVSPAPLLEPPPVLPMVAKTADRDPALALIDQDQERRTLRAIRRDLERSWNRDSSRLLEQFRVQEVKSWQETEDLVSQQSEPLVLDEVLRLNLEEDSNLPPDRLRVLLATKSDLPLVINDRVLRYVNYFLGRGQSTLRESLRRAGSYRPMISRILAEEGVPQDLIYVVQAESGFRPQARSPKKATGMWQFVSGRGREYGLSQTKQLDERLDPEKATHAAARHLADLHAQFGNWYLAMAAYNCGPGGVQRAVEKTGYADYWELVKRGALPRETSNYVPVILAMLLLDKNAEAFHLDDIVPEDPIAYDTVQTDSRIGLNLIADAADTSVSEIKRLNPALLGQSTPDGPYSLRIPKDTAEEFEREIAAVPEERRSSWRRHRVLEGETLSQIASQYHVKVQDIIQVNQLGDKPLRAGERLTIPVPPAPVVRRAGWKGKATASRTAHPVSYRVKPGDSLGSIAQRFHVSIAQLQAWNHLKGVRLIAGQTLNVHPVSLTPVASAGRVTRRTVTKTSQTRRAAVPGGRMERTRTLVAATAAN